MDSQLRSKQLYQRILNNFFDKLKNNLPKKYQSLKDFIQKMRGFHYLITKRVIFVRNNRGCELILYFV